MKDGAAQAVPAPAHAHRDASHRRMAIMMARGVMDRRGRRWFLVDRLLLIDAREVSFPVLIYLECGHEFRIIVLAGKAEMRPLVAAQDLAVIAAAGGLHRLNRSTRAVIVSGYRQRPTAQQFVVVEQQLG